jgi:hypothetical protein
VIVHHTGHAGERSRGASRLLDEPDAIWTLTKDQKPASHTSDEDFWEDMSPTRFLQAYGRDVSLDPEELEYDEFTRMLTLTGRNKRAALTSKRKEDRKVSTHSQVREMFRDGKARSKTAIVNALVGIGKEYRSAAIDDLIETNFLYDSGSRSNGATLWMWTDNPKPVE